MRNTYYLRLNINKRKFNKVIIDQHYREKHSETICDELILQVVRSLNNGLFNSEVNDEEYEYFKVEPVFYKRSPYRIIFLLFIHEATLGVINCFRVKRNRYE
jgi:hypothetical protein